MVAEVFPGDAAAVVRPMTLGELDPEGGRFAWAGQRLFDDWSFSRPLTPARSEESRGTAGERTLRQCAEYANLRAHRQSIAADRRMHIGRIRDRCSAAFARRQDWRCRRATQREDDEEGRALGIAAHSNVPGGSRRQ